MKAPYPDLILNTGRGYYGLNTLWFSVDCWPSMARYFPVPSPESVLGKVICNDNVLKNIVNNSFIYQIVLNPNAYLIFMFSDNKNGSL